MKDTRIGWCHHTVNFWMGCQQVSEECEGCYAEDFMRRKHKNFNVLRLTRGPWFEAEELNARARSRGTHELVFTCSLSDFFHAQADPWRCEAWDVIRRCRNLIWLILTKLPGRIPKCLPSDWNDGTGFPHVWLGTTCGIKTGKQPEKSYERVDQLRQVKCQLRFLSCEPLLSDISDLDLGGIGWILCGGMSGKLWKDRSMKLEWAASLYDAAQRARVPFLFKQISDEDTEQGINALGLYLAHRSGQNPDFTKDYCIREYPESELSFIQPAPKGKQWTQKEWDHFLRRGQHAARKVHFD